jgi:Cof subfamily protein (haloacid dehalogenase superfamily)
MNNVAAKIRLIVFDVDGTLIDDNKALSLKTISVLHEMQQRGVAISFATGKTLPSVEELVKTLNIKVPIILSNGALIQRPNRELVFSEFLPGDVVSELLEASESCGADLVVYSPDHIFAKEETTNTDQMKINYKEGIEAIGAWVAIQAHFSLICKVIFVNRLDIPLINRLKADLQAKLEGRVTFSMPTQNSIEVMPFGVSKKTGLVRLVEVLHLSVEEVMVFGDQMNDIDIIEHAGVGVAVGNAVSEVKAIADYVVGSNNEDGPADFLEEYFKLKKSF